MPEPRNSPRAGPLGRDVAQALERRLEGLWPGAWLAGGGVLAVSGGADSMALLRAAAALVGEQLDRLTAAHFDHRLRPESAADAEFVAAACRSLGVAYAMGVWSDAPDPERGGLEANARRARYQFLRQTAEARGARYVATAHTADDQAETILHRIVRGTGLRGLAGIRGRRPLSPTVTLVRPLLETSRRELLEYLTSLGQDYRTDETNLDRRRTRNRLRHELLPLLGAEFNPQVASALIRLGRLSGEAQETLDELGGRLLAASIISQAAERVELDVGAWPSQPAQLGQGALRQLWSEQRWPERGMNACHWTRLAGLATGARATGRLELPHRLSAIRRGARLVLEAVATS
jgi:tRNA(Ile)-lysidine synthase